MLLSNMLKLWLNRVRPKNRRFEEEKKKIPNETDFGNVFVIS